MFTLLQIWEKMNYDQQLNLLHLHQTTQPTAVRFFLSEFATVCSTTFTVGEIRTFRRMCVSKRNIFRSRKREDREKSNDEGIARENMYGSLHRQPLHMYSLLEFANLRCFLFC